MVGILDNLLRGNMFSNMTGNQTRSLPGSAFSGASVIGGGGNVGNLQAPAAAFTSGGPDYSWMFWAEKAQNNGYSACAAVAGYPDNYTYSGNTVTLDKNRGTPFVSNLLQFSLTKPGGGYLTGSLSYGLQKNAWAPAQLANSDIASSLHKQLAFPYQPGEVLTAYSNSTNVDEEQIVGAMVGYGGFPHPYPFTLQDCMNTIGLQPKQIWNVDCTITPGTAITPGGTTGMATLDSASQADLWLDVDSTYYIIGALPQTGNSGVKNQGFLQVKGNMGEYWNYRQAAIPLILGPGAEPLGTNPHWVPAYEPIGPFQGDALPTVGAFATVAGVFTFALCIVKV